MYLPAVKYSLSVTTMTMKELHSVQSLITAVTLNKLGYPELVQIKLFELKFSLLN